MKTLNDEINRIHNELADLGRRVKFDEVNRICNELADLGCQTMFDISCFELAEKIVNEVIENADVVEW